MMPATLDPKTTALFVCDIQERFKGVIYEYPSVISVAGKMVNSGAIISNINLLGYFLD
jgi:hypothetical protein